MKKRGISTVVASVLIILITIAATSIVFVSVRSIVSKPEDIRIENVLEIRVDEGYTFYEADKKFTSIQIHRKADEYKSELVMLDFIFDVEGDSYTVVIEDFPRKNEDRVYYFDSELGEPKSIAINAFFIFDDDKIEVSTPRVEIPVRRTSLSDEEIECLDFTKLNFIPSTTLEDVDIWEESIYEKVMEDSFPKQMESIQIKAAKNEYEPFQIVLKSDNDKEINVAVSDLIISGSEIDSSNVKIFEERYVELFECQKDSKGDCIRDSDGKIIYVSKGFSPEVLILSDGDIELESGKNHPIWIDVYVPGDAVDGIYTGNLIVTSDGESAQIPIELEVWNFILPDESSFSYNVGMYLELEEVSNALDYKKNVLKLLSEYHINGIVSGSAMPFPRITKNEDDNVDIDFSEFDEVISYARGLGFRRFTFPINGETFRNYDWDKDANGTIIEPGEGWKKIVKDYITKVSAHLKEKGWFDNFILYAYDEPCIWSNQKEHTSGAFNHCPFYFIEATTNIIFEAEPMLENNLLTTHSIDNQLNLNTKMWDVPSASFSKGNTQKLHGQGDEAWMYSVWSITDNYLDGRLRQWQFYNDNLDGYHNWAIMWGGWGTKTGNPWEGLTENGNAQWIFNGNEIGLENDVVPTVRLALLRQAQEDYEYLKLLESQQGVEYSKQISEQMAKGSLLKGKKFYSTEYSEISEDDFNQVREFVANKILGNNVNEPEVLNYQELEIIESRIVDDFEVNKGWHPDDQNFMESNFQLDCSRNLYDCSGKFSFSRLQNPYNNGCLNWADYGVSLGRIYLKKINEDWQKWDTLEFDYYTDELYGDTFLFGIYKLKNEQINFGEGVNLGSISNGSYPGEWHHAVVNLNFADASKIGSLLVIARNRDLREQDKNYNLWIDNLVLKKYK